MYVISNAQTKVTSAIQWSSRLEATIGRVAVPTPTKDTLYVTKDSTGDMIRSVWEQYPLRDVKTPVIVSISDDMLMQKFLQYYKDKNNIQTN
jgi:hypothetical protein